MSIITRMLKQTGVYWPFDAVDDFGQPTYGAAVEISVRWEDSNQEFIDSEGETQISSALVYVSQDVVVKGRLYLGVLADVGSSGLPSTVNPTWEIRKYDKLPNLRATEFLRSVFL